MKEEEVEGNEGVRERMGGKEMNKARKEEGEKALN